MTDSADSAMRRPPQQTRETIRRYQQRSLQKLLQHVWEHSPFYRDYYANCGIRQKDLLHLTVRDLPLLSKQMLMENFDAAVTDPQLKRKELEQWIQDNPDPCANFRRDFIVVYSSGSSGKIGIFIYDQKAWRVANSTMASRLPLPDTSPSEKIRAAFYLASHGHFGGVSTATRMPKALYDTLILSLRDFRARIVEQLNAFQPQQLHGYSSSVAALAELALQGKLHIRPKRIFVSGDKLTEHMERQIQEAWSAPIHILYSASESIYIAVKDAGPDEMRVMDDLNIFEVLDEHNRPTSSGGEGRVVLTNLYNYSLPILRYELGDYVVLGTGHSDTSCTTIRDIKGRVDDSLRLPVVLHDGSHASIDPISLSEFYVSDMEKVQFVSQGPDYVQVNYIASAPIDQAVRRQFQHLLDMQGASQTRFEVRRVQHMAPDPQTGRVLLVKFEHTQTRQSSGASEDIHGKESGRVTPLKPLVTFQTETVERSVPESFEQQAAQYPERIAVKTKNFTWSYDALNKTANRVARAILALRGEGQEPVALALDHDAPMIAALLGVLKAGKICVPLDVAYLQERATYILEDSQATLLVTNDKHVAVASEYAQCVQHLVNIDEMDPNLSCENLGLSIAPHTFAYIIYTSGSTGRPKGVVQDHRNILHNAMRYSHGCRIRSEDRVTLLASLSTGQGTPTAFSALLTGATLYPFDMKEEGVASLGIWLQREEISVFISAPTVFRHFVSTLTGMEQFPKLRLIRLGAEQILPSDVELYKKHFSPDCIFGIFLSSTETGNICQYFIDKETELTENIVPVGYAVQDMEVLLLDDAGREVRMNQSGEIVVRSRYLSAGYWNNLALTKAVFQADPAGGEERIYRTGDMGRRRPDGCLEHLGRKDLRVKIRGFGVELEEVEAALRLHHAVREAVVEARMDAAENNCLIAYIVPHQDQTLTTTTLRTFLRAKLPDYMMPSAFVVLDSMPLTPIGKIDRRALPVPDHMQPELAQTFVAPQNALELQLTKMWEQCLGIQPVGVQDDFFDLGGDSLRAMRLVAHIAKVVGKPLPLATLFQAPTVAQLAALLRQEDWSTSWRWLVPIQPRGAKSPFFCVHGGSGLAHYLGPDQPYYGFQPHGLDGRRVPTTIEAMAVDYIKEMRTVQSEGPYFLGGYSYGGLVAFEMAQQLRQQGQEVALLVLFDSPSFRRAPEASIAGSDAPPWCSALTRYRIEISRHLMHLGPLEPQEKIITLLKGVRWRLKGRMQRTEKTMKKVVCQLWLALRGRVPLSLRHFYFLAFASPAIRVYVPQVYSGRVLFFKAATRTEEPQVVWGRWVTGGLDIREMPGGHLAILHDPHVQEMVAQHLTEALHKAHAEAASTEHLSP